MTWNYDGSQLGVITKERKMHIFDPRQMEAAMITKAHEGSKAQRLTWLGDSSKILTQGWSAFNERQYAVYDTRNIDTPLTIKKLDNNNLQAWIHFYDASNVLYVINKGATFTQFFYLHHAGSDGLPNLQLIDQYKGL